jgi:hypothetical protein
MKLPGRIKIRRRFQLLIAGLLGLALAVVLYAGTTSRIDSYTACKDAGFPILDTEPPICRDGLNNFTGSRQSGHFAATYPGRFCEFQRGGG